jgi:hypothetical protein
VTGAYGNAGTQVDSACGGCHDADLPQDPFLALHAASGMLLGEDDFRVLMGNPRGKLMLHNAWLHGRGIVWGCAVVGGATGQVEVSPGLMQDGIGRELMLRRPRSVDVRGWARTHLAALATGAEVPAGSPATSSSTLTAWLVARFATCLTCAVPTVADPCDLTRRHDAFSRVVETVELLITADPPPAEQSYPRLRMLAGLQERQGPQGAEVAAALARVAALPEAERRDAMCDEIRHLALHDTNERTPGADPDCVGDHPVSADDPGVVLARLCIEVNRAGDCVDVGQVDVVGCVAPLLLDTQTISDLLGALAARSVDGDSLGDVGGPRLVDITVAPESDSVIVVRLTAPVQAESWDGGAVVVSSLSDHGRGWSREAIRDIEAVDGGATLRVRLEDRPRHRRVRVLVRGTGPTPLIGREPAVPFAGRRGDPAGTEFMGNDAAVMLTLPGRSQRSAEEE